ncbi:MAG: hypothetical protein ACOC2F_05855 [Bacteroidota bacterium]
MNKKAKALKISDLILPLVGSLRNDSGKFCSEKKRKMKQPAHKTAHSQALTHEPMLQLAKELFFCQCTGGKLIKKN